MVKVVCPKCGKPGCLSFKVVKGEGCSCAAHKESGKVKWCYLGKPAEEP